MAHGDTLDTPWGWMMDSTRRFAAEAEAHTGGAALALAAALAVAVLVLARVCARGRQEGSALLDDTAEEQSVLLDDSKAPPMESPRETPGQRPAPSNKTPALTPASFAPISRPGRPTRLHGSTSSKAPSSSVAWRARTFRWRC